MACPDVNRLRIVHDDAAVQAGLADGTVRGRGLLADAVDHVRRRVFRADHQRLGRLALDRARLAEEAEIPEREMRSWPRRGLRDQSKLADRAAHEVKREARDGREASDADGILDSALLALEQLELLLRLDVVDVGQINAVLPIDPAPTSPWPPIARRRPRNQDLLDAHDLREHDVNDHAVVLVQIGQARSVVRRPIVASAVLAQDVRYRLWIEQVEPVAARCRDEREEVDLAVSAI